jgi:hypothetical protein
MVTTCQGWMNWSLLLPRLFYSTAVKMSTTEMLTLSFRYIVSSQVQGIVHWPWLGPYITYQL